MCWLKFNPSFTSSKCASVAPLRLLSAAPSSSHASAVRARGFSAVTRDPHATRSPGESTATWEWDFCWRQCPHIIHLYVRMYELRNECMHVCKYAMYVYHCISQNHYPNYDPINIHPIKIPSAVRSPLRFPFYQQEIP